VNRPKKVAGFLLKIFCIRHTSFSVSKVEHQLFCTGSAKTLTKNGDWLVYYVVAPQKQADSRMALT